MAQSEREQKTVQFQQHFFADSRLQSLLHDLNFSTILPDENKHSVRKCLWGPFK